jgi:isocitrate dehydrogenase kinase/phosphatase
MFDLVLRSRGETDQTRWVGLQLPMAGRHNVQNSLAAIAVARELGGTEEQIRAALLKFGGVKRRFTPVGDWNGVKIIDDYGHHPVEIAAVLRAARDVQGRDKRVIAVVQPHRYTRLRDLFEQFSTCFNDADEVYRTATKFMNRARQGGGPALIEAMTYRHSGHSRADPAQYRPKGELEQWLERDPIKIYRERLLELGMVEATLRDIEEEVTAQVNEATEAAKASSAPDLAGIHQHVWADGGAAWRN